ncbi:MAG: hypothetical protein K0S11_1109 [Gammaproteobacteria bacterium]|jgi:hypothetical protein|nr:hypothetical protein [Gammaproteobacteria bacterium]
MLTKKRQNHMDEELINKNTNDLTKSESKNRLGLQSSGFDYHFIKLNFENVKSRSKSSISINFDSSAQWSEGPNRKQMTGIKVCAALQKPLLLKNFTMNRKNISFQTYDQSPVITLSAFIEAKDECYLRGRVDLPPNAILTIETLFDRASLVGLSSFAVCLRAQ